MKKIIVTGGSGFIGSNLVDALVVLGHDVIVIDDLSSSSKDNLKESLDKIEFIQESILDVDLNKFKDIDVIFHLAAKRSVPESLKYPNEFEDVNIAGTRRMLELARKNDAKLINSSSSSVYGDAPLPQKEDITKIRLSPYAITKFAAEDYCRLFNKLYGTQAISLRYFNVFGPRQDPSSEYAAVIPKFIRLMMNEERPPIFGDGLQSRDFTFVQNVVSANIKAMDSELNGEAINVANGKPISILDLVKEINVLLDTNINPIFKEERAGDIKDSYADNSLAKEIIGYEELVSFNEGLKKTIDWLKKE